MPLFLIWQIFILSFDAPLKRKARSALTISMVVAGSDLRVALNGMSASQVCFYQQESNQVSWHGEGATPYRPVAIIIII